MPRFYFDHVLDDAVLPDDEGVACDDLACARQEAACALLEIAKDRIVSGKDPDKAILILDEGRRPTLRVSLHILAEACG